MNEPFLSTGRPAVSLASILSHIVVYLDCWSTLAAHSAVDIQKNLQNSEKFSTSSNLTRSVILTRSEEHFRTSMAEKSCLSTIALRVTGLMQ